MPQSVEVIVVGSGLAGLNAALTLQESGRTVQVLEARERVGGRVWSFDGPVGREEGGAINIGNASTRILARVNECGLTLEPLTVSLREQTISVGGQLCTAETWPESGANPLEGPLRLVPPGMLLAGVFMRDNPLTGSRDWTQPEAGQWDVSATEYAKAKGMPAAAIELGDRAGSFDSFASTSALELLRSAQRMMKFERQTSTVLGGNARLPEAMAERLDRPVRLSTPVIGVDTTDEGVTVTLADGERLDAEHVILAVPLPALRSIAVSPSLPAVIERLVNDLPYTPVTKYHVVASKPFWIEDGLPVLTWTDRPAQRVFPWILDEDGPSSLAVWVTGKQARELDALDETEQINIILEELAAARPSLAGCLQVTKIVSWGRDEWAGGAWATPAPGQMTDLATAIATDTGRVQLAGEHFAMDDSGMEGALESGERAALRIQQAG